MSGVNTTTDAQSALQIVIRERYLQDIEGEMWLTKSPSGTPPEEGLGSRDAIDWLITLDHSSKRMGDIGYSMTEITRNEAETARGAKLSGSIALLVAKASVGRQIASSRRRRNVALYLGGGAFVGIVIALATFQLTRKKVR